MATYVTGHTLNVAFFSGDDMPVFTFDAISKTTDLCGTFAYAIAVRSGSCQGDQLSVHRDALARLARQQRDRMPHVFAIRAEAFRLRADLLEQPFGQLMQIRLPRQTYRWRRFWRRWSITIKFSGKD